ncbi:carotenoid biosynthesis protein [Nonlabens antarcticus]|uniref:carotenoid biosynthesis protein n=1 Tax=Nonlabens antarcticus TaxID=392714 RepID=UPI00189156FE|nr:carotenoid biosynthesis protein [Nonlabens antarcticus]
MKNVLIVFLWIVHVSAIIGLALGYDDFFLPKSPFTMLLLLGLLVAYFPVLRTKNILLFLLFMAAGMGAEWIGVHTGILFGDYAYGINFGPKLDGIPYLIGTNWGILTFVTHQIVTRFFKNIWAIAALGASLMVLLDFFLEQVCAYAGYWSFEGGVADWLNYVCWFVLAFILHIIARRAKLTGDFKISIHIYIVQLIFAATLWIIISTT